jgi:hypothetical protein
MAKAGDADAEPTALIAAAKGGDLMAFETLYRRLPRGSMVCVCASPASARRRSEALGLEMT